MQRTIKQNKAIHKWFEEVSRECNDRGIDMKVLVENLRVDTSPESVKDIFRQIGAVKYGKKSTADLTTSELMGCYEEFNRLLGQNSLHIPFPSNDFNYE
jgi:hypothetical protein